MSFKDRLLEALKRIFTSVKVITTITGLIVAFAAKRGIILSPEDVEAVIILFSVLVGAQGVTDLGVRKAQVENQKPPDRIEQTVNVDTSDSPSMTRQRG